MGNVSEEFVEDPVRVLRLARLQARFYHLGFQIADETVALVRHMVKNGVLKDLVPERIWQEWEKSLAGEHPEIFIKTLIDLGAIGEIFPLLRDVNLKPMLERLVAVSAHHAMIRFAAFLLGLPNKHQVDAFCRALRVPNAYRDLARLAQLFY